MGGGGQRACVWGSRVLIPARIVCVLMKRMGGTCSDARLCPDASGRGKDSPILSDTAHGAPGKHALRFHSGETEAQEGSSLAEVRVFFFPFFYPGS